MFRHDGGAYKLTADATPNDIFIAISEAIVPTGLISMWSGAVSAIPTGWALCNGSNGTPDLRGKFVVGAGGSYAVGVNGGAASVVLNKSQMPSHSHDNGTLTISPSVTSVGYSPASARSGTSSYFTYVPSVYDTSEAPILSGEIGFTGSGAPHANRPPYYALAYSMFLGIAP